MCCFRDSIQQKLLREHLLVVDEAVDPTLILWQNLGFSKASRRCRTLLTWFFSLLLIIGTMFVVMHQANWNKKINEISPQIDCAAEEPSPYTLEGAWEDKALGTEGKGVLYCYCKENMWKLLSKGGDVLPEYKAVFTNSDAICEGFVSRYMWGNILTYGTSFAIIILTWLAKTILRLISSFEKSQTKSEEMLESAILMFCLSYVNVGVVLFLVNFNIGSGSDWLNEHNIPLF